MGILRRWCLLFQFTLPRGERPDPDKTLEEIREVSIHAPARGATGHVSREQAHIDVSIHAPARGATADELSGS